MKTQDRIGAEIEVLLCIANAHKDGILLSRDEEHIAATVYEPIGIVEAVPFCYTKLWKLTTTGQAFVNWITKTVTAKRIAAWPPDQYSHHLAPEGEGK